MAAPPRLERLTVADATTRYLVSVERSVLAGNLSPATRENYRRDLAEFVRLAGPDIILDDLDADTIDDIVLAYAAEPDKRYTKTAKPGPAGSPGRGTGAQARFRQSISGLFTQAQRRGWIQVNPMPDTVVRPKARGMAAAARTAVPEQTAVALLDTPEDAEQHSRADQKLSARDSAILRILIEVGPRVSELCSLDRSDIQIRNGVMWLVIRHGKGGKERDLPLSPSTAAALTELLETTRPAPPESDSPIRREDAERAVFTSFRGRRMKPRDIQNLVKRLCGRLPADVRRRVTPHGLRHTAATILLSSGAADIKTVQSLLGHASLATTGIYLDQISHEMVKAVSAHPVTSK